MQPCAPATPRPDNDALRPAAQADLIEIGDYIAIDNPDRALSFFAEFEALIFSAIAARHHRYLAFFTHNAERIEVLRILHGARDLQSFLN